MSPMGKQKTSNSGSKPMSTAGSKAETRQRVAISGISPEIESGRFPIKRVVGENVLVEANIFTDGHDSLSCSLLIRDDSSADWEYLPMQPLGNDRWGASFSIREQRSYFYTVAAVVDPFLTWQRDLRKRVTAGQQVDVDLLIGAELIESAARRIKGEKAKLLDEFAASLRDSSEGSRRVELALNAELLSLMSLSVDRSSEARYPRELRVHVDRDRAGFSAWYEMFPRSAKGDGTHGSFRDCIAWLDYISSMGFDILYLPPIHPIGLAFRKGRNNRTDGDRSSAGSPWAIGGEDGGHTAIHSELGTLADFRDLVSAAREKKIEIALDIAFQCSPDHPYVKEHPEWFRARPDGSIQYAENPPKKYQDIYPLNFESEDWEALWDELKNVVEYWIGEGIRVFRVDNPHTKPLGFWEWLIREVQKHYPDTIFLSEAFTRPNVMYELAKRGFTQSYTYFSWRNTKRELEEYLTELTRTEVSEYFRPNFWPNTPDILTEYLQTCGRPGFISRLCLAATLSSNYGIYGPAFELCEHRPRESGSEEYLDSEKYEIRTWNLNHPHSLKELIARVNRIRRENPALRTNRTLVFHRSDNDHILVYSKRDLESGNTLIMVVNLDPHHTQSAWTDLNLDALGLDEHSSFEIHDLLAENWYTWQGRRNFLLLDPNRLPVHVFRIHGARRSEKDYEFYR